LAILGDFFQIERYGVGIGARREVVPPPMRDSFRRLYLQGAEIAPGRRQEVNFFFSEAPPTETLDHCARVGPQTERPMLINIFLHNDDFAYYYEIVKTEGNRGFMYMYSLELDPNNTMPVYYANVSGSGMPGLLDTLLVFPPDLKDTASS
jgi:hypothetical protein